MPKQPRVSFVITTYNNRDIIGSCLDYIRGQSYTNFDITVVDDHSTDRTPEFVRKRYPGVKVITKEKQTGPSISRNLGIKATKSDYIAFLDSDINLDRHWLRRLVELLDNNPEVGIAAGKLLYGSNRRVINSAGGGLFRMGIGFDRGSGASAGDYSQQENVIYVCSAAMLVRRSMIAEIGGFDDTYFYGHEDTDLGWRANLAGWRVVYLPNVVAYHLVNQTVRVMGDNVYFHSAKNRIRSILKNYNTLNALYYLCLNVAVTVGGIILVKGHRMARLRGIGWNLTHLGNTLRMRAEVQGMRKISDSQLFRLFSPWNPGMIKSRRSL